MKDPQCVAALIGCWWSGAALCIFGHWSEAYCGVQLLSVQLRQVSQRQLYRNRKRSGYTTRIWAWTNGCRSESKCHHSQRRTVLVETRPNSLQILQMETKILGCIFTFTTDFNHCFAQSNKHWNPSFEPWTRSGVFPAYTQKVFTITFTYLH